LPQKSIEVLSHKPKNRDGRGDMTIVKAIAVFNSNHDTLKAESLFKVSQISVRPIIKPRKIGSNCALALEFPYAHSEKVLEIGQANRLSLIGIFQNKKGIWKKAE